MDPLPLENIQGLIVRGYGMDALRVFVLTVQDAALSRQVLARLPVASAEVWAVKPDFCVNVAITFEGLRALGITNATLQGFPEEFRDGAAMRANIVGDTGDSDPSTWKGGLGGTGVHRVARWPAAV